AGDAGFRAAWREAKANAKARFIDYLRRTQRVALDPAALFDVQVKRIHEYKRQTLALLHAVALYRRVRAGEERLPRALLLAGKAAPGYWMAKRIIRATNDVAAVVNADPAVAGRLQVLFVPNYSVTLAEMIMPAADLSEQISVAGSEASGTGN